MSLKESYITTEMISFRKLLCKLYHSSADVRLLLHDAGLDDHCEYINLEGSINDVWHETLGYLAKGNLLVGLLNLLASPGHYSERSDFAQALSDVRRVLTSRPPPGTSGSTLEPYPGLFAYTTRDASIFYGRDREIGESIALLKTNPTLFLCGPSGAGKSSLARAGLIPMMAQEARKRDRTLGVIDLDRLGVSPFETLASALKDQSSGDEVTGAKWNAWVTRELDPPPPSGPPHTKSLEDLIRSLAKDPSREWVLLFDQLEEVATLRDAPQRDKRDRFLDMLDSFGTWLHATTEQTRRVRMICTVRSDLLGELLAHAGFDALYKRSGRTDLGALATAELHRVIQGPLEGRNAEVENGLAEKIVADTGRDVGSIPLLNQVLRELWQERSGEQTPRLTNARYDALGGVRGVLDTVAKEARAQVPGEHEATLKRVLLALLHYDEGRALRRVVDIETLGEQCRCEVATVEKVVAPFVERRLLVLSETVWKKRGSALDEMTRTRTVEVAHEALFEAWEEYRELIKNLAPMQSLQADVHKAATQWFTQQYAASELWGDGVQLHRAEEARDRGEIELNDVEGGFVRKSRQVISERARHERESAERERRQNSSLRHALAALGCAATFIALLLVQAWRERSRAERNRARAEGLIEFMLQTQEGPLRATGLTSLYAASVRRVEEYHDDVRRSGDEVDGAALRQESIAQTHRGDVQLSRGDLDGALASYRTALAPFERLARRNPDDPELLQNLARSHDRIGDVHRRKGDVPAAQAAYQISLGLFERLAAVRPSNEHQQDLGHALLKVGDVCMSRGDLDRGIVSYERSLEIRAGLANQNVLNADWQRDVGVVESNLADAWCSLGGVTPRVLQLYRSALHRAEELTQRDPSNAVWRTDVVLYSMNLARALVTRTDGRDEAIEQARRAMTEMQALQREHRLTSDQERFWLPASLAMVSALEHANTEQMRYWRPVVLTGSLGPGSSLEGSEQGFACRATITLPSSPRDPCLITVLYGKRVLYGPSMAFRCQVSDMSTVPQVTGLDEGTGDGNGTVVIDTVASTLRVTDIARGDRPAFRAEIRITGRGP